MSWKNRAWNRNWVAAALAGSAGLTGVACSGSVSNTSVGVDGKTPAPPDIGGPLLSAAPMPLLPNATPVGEAILIPNAVVNYDVRVQVAAAVDAVVEVIGYPVDKADPKFNPADPDIIYHPRDLDKVRPFRRLRQDDVIREKQILARLDEQLVSVQITAQTNIVKACEIGIAASRVAEEKQEAQLTLMKKLGNSLSNLELLQQEGLLARYIENRATSEQTRAKAIGELLTAQTQLSRYFVESKINGRVVRIVKSPQEFCKAGETIMEIQSTDRVRVEGKVDVAYASKIRRGMRVVVEPNRAVGPDQLVTSHRQEVTSVAVTAHPGRPMIVSGGLDAAAQVWDMTATKVSYRLPHPAGTGVRAVAASGPKGKGHLVATGTDDGRIRLWDVSNPDRMPKEPSATFDEALPGAVTSLAFSPDGRYLAAASGRDITIWTVADARRLYVLPSEHRAAVTSVRFTPQGTLLSVAQDKSLRTWKLGDKGGTAAGIIDHRGGNVDVLGLSSDGGRVLFDKDPGRLDVVSMSDERSVGTLQNPSQGARFATLALFSADDKTILTVGSESDQKGEITLWETPAAGSRAAERRRLLTPKNAAVTCAAFSPDADKRFVAVGTQDGGVYFWMQNAQDDVSKPIIGEVVSVTPVDSKSFQVRVEMSNPLDKNGEGLQDRSQATIIIPPDSAVIPPLPQPAPAPNVPIKPAAGGLIPASATAPVVRPAGPEATPPAAVPNAALPPLTAPPAPVAPLSGVPVPSVSVPEFGPKK